MERLAPGSAFGPYIVEGLVASGGMGSVYAAHNPLYGGTVALKVLHGRLHADSGWRHRFNEEGLVGAQLKHPHVLSARELVEHEGAIALVLDLVAGGQTLEKLMTRAWPDGLPIHVGLQFFLGIIQGVEYLHLKGIIHGDLKPENVLVVGEARSPERWVPRVTDFGTVALIAHPVVLRGRAAVVATPRYASPEHLEGVDSLVAASDIYALGLILHFLVTGKHASDARSVQEAMFRVGDPVPEIHLVDMPEAFREVFRKAVQVQPEMRFASARELAVAVRGVLDSMGHRIELADLAANLATEVEESDSGSAVEPGEPATQAERVVHADDLTEERAPLVEANLAAEAAAEAPGTGQHTELPELGDDDIASLSVVEAHPVAAAEPALPEMTEALPPEVPSTALAEAPPVEPPAAAAGEPATEVIPERVSLSADAITAPGTLGDGQPVPSDPTDPATVLPAQEPSTGGEGAWLWAAAIALVVATAFFAFLAL